MSNLVKEFILGPLVPLLAVIVIVVLIVDRFLKKTRPQTVQSLNQPLAVTKKEWSLIARIMAHLFMILFSFGQSLGLLFAMNMWSGALDYREFLIAVVVFGLVAYSVIYLIIGSLLSGFFTRSSKKYRILASAYVVLALAYYLLLVSR